MVRRTVLILNSLTPSVTPPTLPRPPPSPGDLTPSRPALLTSLAPLRSRNASVPVHQLATTVISR